MSKGPDAFRTISEVSEDLDVPQHVLRFWETRFPTIRPLKRGGGRRYYRPDDVDLIKGIRHLLYGQGYTIRGVQRILKDGGPRTVQAIGRGERAPTPAPPETDLPDEMPDAEAVAGSAVFRDEPPAARLADGDRERLRAALDDLLECERLLQGLRRPAS